MEGLSSSCSKLFSVVYKGLLFYAKPTFRCNIFTYDSRYCVCCLMSVCYEVCVAFYKILGGTDWGLLFCKETNKICKNALFLEFLAYLHFVAW